MATLGKVHDEVTRELSWIIDDFFSLSEEDGKYYDSPSFLFAGEYWYFSIYPNGRSVMNSVGYISVYLCRNLTDPPIRVTLSFGLKTVDGKKYNETQSSTKKFEKKETGFGPPKLLKRSELTENKSKLVPSGILTIFCTVKCSESTDDVDTSDDETSEDDEISEDVADENDKINYEDEVINSEANSKNKYVLSEDKGGIATAECSYCKAAIDTKNVLTHENICLDKPIRCPTCNHAVKLTQCQLIRVAANKKLTNDLSDMLESGEYSDVTIKVKEMEFRLHKAMLTRRNNYFRSMFSIEMKEKHTGIVSIDDCEPDIFKSLVCFLYTGKIDALSNDNVCALYEAADKYQEDQLKAECSNFMMNEISVNNFCDFIAIALNHGEKELLQCATELFCRETNKIIQSVQWQIFLKEYPIQANELYIKAYNAK